MSFDGYQLVWRDKRIAELEAQLEALSHKLSWYETRFKPPVQPPTEQYMSLLPQQDKQTRTKIPKGVATVRNVVTGKTTPTRGDKDD